MATIDEVYQLALQNRTALNSIKDKAKETADFTDAGVLNDSDEVRVVRGGSSLKSTVGAIKAASGGGDNNVQSDWLQGDNTQDDFIKNKPQNLSDFNNDLPDTGGDMRKAVYDTNNSNVVDDSEMLGGQLPSFYNQNAHVADSTIHVTAVQKDALDNANAPTDVNPFATLADITNLTQDERDAISNANAPTAVNPFATLADVQAGGRFFDLPIVAKHPNNSNMSLLETNDMVHNFYWDTTLYIRIARYDGGDTAVIGNYTIIDSVSF